jgi:hypothetical protein
MVGDPVAPEVGGGPLHQRVRPRRVRVHRAGIPYCAASGPPGHRRRPCRSASTATGPPDREHCREAREEGRQDQAGHDAVESVQPGGSTQELGYDGESHPDKNHDDAVLQAMPARLIQVLREHTRPSYAHACAASVRDKTVRTIASGRGSPIETRDRADLRGKFGRGHDRSNGRQNAPHVIARLVDDHRDGGQLRSSSRDQALCCHGLTPCLDPVIDQADPLAWREVVSSCFEDLGASAVVRHALVPDEVGRGESSQGVNSSKRRRSSMPASIACRSGSAAGSTDCRRAAGTRPCRRSCSGSRCTGSSSHGSARGITRGGERWRRMPCSSSTPSPSDTPS